jgi:DEAD/DEAH box helicase domain-containing protein
LTAKFPQGLYSHQAQAIEESLQGKNVVIATGTASGKTLSFAVPVLQALLEDRDVRALFFYPTKALAGDQLYSLIQMADSFNLGGSIYRFDGDVSTAERMAALARGRILLCTPDVLNATMLRRNLEPEFRRLFKNLRYVVLDECHVYTGAFGSNMAFVMRRLRQSCARNGNYPQFIAASATSSAPRTHLELLTGLRFVEISKNGSPSGGREFFLLQHTGSLNQLIAELVKQNKRFIAFCHSRRLTEQSYIDFEEQYPELAKNVMPYRSGYELHDRVAIENALRLGDLNGVFSTSALELGVDLPSMEYCILIGIPASAMSFWQRVGRVGRSQHQVGKVIIFPGDNAIDDYYKEHPEKLFERELEKLVLHLDNRQLLLSHFACARAESGDFDNPNLNAEIFGQEFIDLAQKVTEIDIADDILITPDPHFKVGLRGIDDPSFEIFTLGGEHKLGTITWSQILREAYPQAVYRHMGETYRVDRILTRDQLLKVKKERASAKTSPVGYIHVKEKTGSGGVIYRKTSWGNLLEMWHTSVLVVTRTTGYREKIGENWHQEKYPQPLQRRVLSEGVWLKFPREFGQPSRAALNALAHALSNTYAIYQPCDPNEMATHCTTAGNGNDSSILYIFDTTSGGLGITQGVFDYFPDLLKQARLLLERCDHCDPAPDAFDRGCPACIQVPRWFEDNESLSKSAALELLEKIEDILAHKKPSITIAQAYKDRSLGHFTTLSASVNEEIQEVTDLMPITKKAAYALGSTIALRSGLTGTVVNRRIQNNGVQYDLKLTDDRIINVLDMGNNLRLETGAMQLICLSCGNDQLSETDSSCAICGINLVHLFFYPADTCF